MGHRVPDNNKVLLIFFIPRENRYSFNALLGAIEGHFDIKRLNISLISETSGLYREISHYIPYYRNIYIFFSFFTTQITRIRDVLNGLKKACSKKIILIAGGAHPTGDPEGTLSLGFDMVVRGEGELTIIELIRMILQGRNIRSVKGIFYKDAKDIIFTGSGEDVVLDRFKPFSTTLKRFGPIEITRGCPWGCFYCQTPRLFKPPIKHRSLESILEAVDILLKHNLGDIRFITPNALCYGSSDGRTVEIEKVETLLYSIRKRINQKGRVFFGSFPSEVRPEHITDETIKILKEYTDNKNLVIGAQSGSERILHLCHRGHTVDDVYNAVALSVKAGFIPNVDFIFGLPGETDEDVLMTEKVINDLVGMGARIHAHTFMPLPQTPFASSPPGSISPVLRKTINRLVNRGVIFGDWQKQEKLASEIYNYLHS